MLVSLAFAPILLSVSPTPAFETTKPLSLRQIMEISPLGCVGMFLLGGVFSAQFGMAPVYGAEAGLSVAQISIFVSMFFIGSHGAAISHRLAVGPDGPAGAHLRGRRADGGGRAFGWCWGGRVRAAPGAAFVIGGMSNPLYSLLIAYTNDFLDHDDMAAAAGGMVFINGLGAVTGPLITGWLMGVIGPQGFFVVIAVLSLSIAAYAAYRMTQRAAPGRRPTATWRFRPRPRRWRWSLRRNSPSRPRRRRKMPKMPLNPPEYVLFEAICYCEFALIGVNVKLM